MGQLARLAGVSERTLHHYDALGLLVPAHVALNGYRTYGRAEAERLQEILFYRAIGMGLAEIAELLESGADRLTRLSKHRADLARQALNMGQTLATLDRTIADLKGVTPMTPEDLYRPFAPEKQAAYEAWLINTYGGDMADRIASAKAHLDSVPEGMEDRMAELAEVEGALVAAFHAGDTDVDGLLVRHRDWVASMWGRPCSPDAYAGLADMYQTHPDFVARYEALAPKFSV